MDRNLTVNEQHELRILELVEERDRITQRGVATELEVAVGMANALIKRLVHKGYIKVKEAPSRRYGYYITPELVGGKDGKLIGNMVAYHMQKSLNWGLAAAMGAVLLGAILILYWVYDKIVGIDNMKLA